MVRVVDCHAGVLGSNPGGPKKFSLWNCFTVDELSKKCVNEFLCRRVVSIPFLMPKVGTIVLLSVLLL